MTAFINAPLGVNAPQYAYVTLQFTAQNVTSVKYWRTIAAAPATAAVAMLVPLKDTPVHVYSLLPAEDAEYTEAPCAITSIPNLKSNVGPKPDVE